MLIANLNTSADHALSQTHSLKKSIVFNINGIKIGVIGYLTPETKSKSLVGSGVDFFPENSSIK